MPFIYFLCLYPIFLPNGDPERLGIKDEMTSHMESPCSVWVSSMRPCCSLEQSRQESGPVKIPLCVSLTNLLVLSLAGSDVPIGGAGAIKLM